MRKSVLTGLFACTLVLVSSTASASALTQEQTNQINETTVVELLAIETKTTLVVLSENEALTRVVDAQPKVPEETKVTKHVVTENESLSDIAKMHDTTWNRLFDKNTTLENPDVISIGTELVIPAPDEVIEPRALPEPPAPIKATNTIRSSATRVSTPITTTSRGSTVGNGYVAGYCTWYVKNKRPDMPNNLGNAATWVSRAASQGLATGGTPAVGAVGQRGNHVVYVESVNDDGTVTISEMNHKGLYVMTTRTLAANYFSYIY